jgi:hypothetical protein
MGNSVHKRKGKKKASTRDTISYCVHAEKRLNNKMINILKLQVDFIRGAILQFLHT